MDTNHLKSERNFYRALFNGSGRYGVNPWGEEPSKLMVELLEKHNLTNGSGKRALDLGCGQGRHIALLRQYGYQVVGVDFSQDALDICKRRFAGDDLVMLRKVDLTVPGSLENLGDFDLVLQWSVLDHIRAKYVKDYLKNVIGAVKSFLIVSEFSIFQGMFKNKPYKIEGGHYSRAYKSQELDRAFEPLQAIDIIENKDDGAKYWGIKFHTILFQNQNKEKK